MSRPVNTSHICFGPFALFVLIFPDKTSKKGVTSNSEAIVFVIFIHTILLLSILVQWVPLVIFKCFSFSDIEGFSLPVVDSVTNEIYSSAVLKYKSGFVVL